MSEVKPLTFMLSLGMADKLSVNRLLPVSIGLKRNHLRRFSGGKVVKRQCGLLAAKREDRAREIRG